MKDEKTRYNNYMQDNCPVGAQNGAQTIIVRQVLGEKEKQKVLDIHVHVPERKPAIEQIIDVFVKDVAVTSVDVITDQVIVRGEFEVKAIYVASLPNNPVHAIEIKHCKFTQDIDICGARPGMDAEANVKVEFVDYDVAEMTRAYKYKYHGKYDPCDDSVDSDGFDSDPCDMKDKCHPCHHECPPHKPEHPCHDMPICPPPSHPMPPCPPNPCEAISTRDFDVSVILLISAKVLADREVQMNPKKVTGTQNVLPEKPKG